jgi:hypothetical protein
VQPLLEMAAPASAAGTGTASRGCADVHDERGDGRNEQEQRGTDVQQHRHDRRAPPSLARAGQPDRRPERPATGAHIGSSYFVSFGGTPMTLTPAPRAASIAVITS